MNGRAINPGEGFDSGWISHPSQRAPVLGSGRVLLIEPDEAGKQALEIALLKEGLQMASPAAPAVQRVAKALGAADCVGKTSSAADIAARVRGVLSQAPTSVRAPRAYAGIKLDPSGGRAWIGGHTAHLTPSECAVLEVLLEARGRVVQREQLVHPARAKAGALPLARSIDAHVRALRRKLEDDVRRPTLIQSVRGFGYRRASAADPPVQALAEAAFAALPEAALVVDGQGQVKLMNHMAMSLAGVPEHTGMDCTCAGLLQCSARQPARRTMDAQCSAASRVQSLRTVSVRRARR